jgi:hypothetical protein
MEDEFRAPLERRISTLRGLRNTLHDQLRALHHELNSVDRRLERAEDMYRNEYGQEPPDVETRTRRRRASRIRGGAQGAQPAWREAVLEVLRAEGGPLHVKEIWERLQTSGFQTEAVDPLRSIVTIAIRHEDQFRRAGPNTYALNGGLEPAASEEGEPQ